LSRTAAPTNLTYREDVVGGVGGWWCEPANAPTHAVILHLHGGWFNWGTAEAFRHLVGHMARSAGVSAFVPDYRLAPEHPFPAATEDAEACYLGLLSAGRNAVAVTGDSAGGNLALVLLAAIATAPATFGHGPAAGVLVSPVTDLTLSGGSWETRAEADPFFVRDQALALVESYLQGADPADP
jgi:epsilon-lactone hydrolase